MAGGVVMLTRDIMEMLWTQPSVTSADVVAYADCTPRQAIAGLTAMVTRGTLMRIAPGVFAANPGARLLRPTWTERALQALPGTRESIAAEMGILRIDVRRVLYRLRRLGHPTSETNGVYDLC